MFPSLAATAAALLTVAGLFLLLWFWPKLDIRGDAVCALAALAALALVQVWGGGVAKIGLGLPVEGGWLRLTGTALAICLSVYAVKALVIDLLLGRLIGVQAQRFDVEGHFRNKGVLVRSLGQSLYASTSEEILFRGFLQSATFLLASSVLPSVAAGLLSIVGPALLFGVCHRSQGTAGIATATVVGLVFGTWFLILGQTLWPLILAHVLINALTDVVLFYTPPDILQDPG